jgi:hypothetical protein
MPDTKRAAEDEASVESFPASDPPARSGVTGIGRGRKDRKPSAAPPSSQRTEDARPTGHPHSDRHAQETAHYSEDEDPG